MVKAYVADIIPSEYRGRAYGIYNAAISLTTLPASFLAGFLWDKISPATPFHFGAIMALLAAITLFLFNKLYPPI